MRGVFKLSSKTVKEAYLYEKLTSGRVKCTACSRYCKIPEGSHGYCFVRKNIGGKLYLLVYSKAIAANMDPIEKKPFYHFMPGTYVYSIATIGCNWRCSFCQNWSISHESEIQGIYLPPETIVKETIEYGGHGIAYTYTEPTIFIEYAYDTSVLAHKRGLYNVFVTNGYETEEAIKLMSPYLDAAVVDFKGGGDENFARRHMKVPSIEPIYNTLKLLRREGVHIEVTNLVIPKLGDDPEQLRSLASWIRENLGPDTPLHLLRFYPYLELRHLPITPQETLEKLYNIAKEEGLEYVYVGNIHGHKYENTYCPRCGTMVIGRTIMGVYKWNLDKDTRCPNCGHKIPIIVKPSKLKSI